MNKLIYLLLFASFFAVTTTAQESNDFTLQSMSKLDKEKLSELPALILPENAQKRIIPAVVDNSLLPYFRPLIAQVGLECGQASSIGVMFTYEINAKRGVPGNVPENQYPTHFAYNFINGGSDAGVSFWETFEILKHAGTPNVADYGGMATGGPSRWISGYDNYFHGMFNRIEGAYSIKTNTIEGLQTLKNWIYDHGNGSEMGGIATFYSEFNHPPNIFPPGTPEAGKHVIVIWGNSPNHAMSMVGYNDSIRWDYNNDGRYTNNIDLNNDGIIDISDWEIGGFKMANTYGSISGWGDNGFSYMMYKTVADQFGQGGIWNNMAAVLKMKDAYHPKLTAKVNLTYPCRSKLKVMVGVATDTSASEPEYIYHYPIFDFQGGCMAMQGSSGDEHIEFGLDLNPLLSYFTPGEEVKFFLMVADNSGVSFNIGQVNSFSINDYTDLTPVETVCAQTNVNITANAITKLSLKASVDFSPPIIDNETLPTIELYADYNTQLTASGGTEPYVYSLVNDYQKIDSSHSYPAMDGERLSIGNNNAYTAVDLPFEFPFFGEKISKVYPTTEGFIMFKETLLPWPYYIEGRTYFIENKMIAPCFSNPFYFDGTNNNGLWYSQNADSCAFKWKMSTYGISGNSMVELTVSLFPDGRIHFYYGPHHAPDYVEKFAGISAGDGENYILLNEIGSFNPYGNQFTLFEPNSMFAGISLTEDGLLTGVVDEIVENQSIKVKVKDYNTICSTKVYQLAIEGVEIIYEVVSGDDDIIEFGEEFSMNLNLHNLYNELLGEGTLTFRSSDPNLVIQDSIVELSSLPADGSMSLTDVFAISVLNTVENGHIAYCDLVYATEQNAWTRHINLVLNAPVLQINTVSVLDGENGILEPGETAQLVVTFQNSGGAKLNNLIATLNCDNSDLQIVDGEDNVAILSQNGIWQANFQVYFSENAEPLQILELQLSVLAANDFSFNKVVPLITSLNLENFETSNFDLFDWETSGTAEWFITSDPVYEGSYSARSGAMGDNGNSVLSLPYDVAYSDTISFYFKVSSENNYDFLKFLINSELQQQWSGEVDWTHVVYSVSSGSQLFSWRYEKDYSVSNGLDCALIDYIILPVRNVETSVIDQPAETDVQLVVLPNPFIDQLTLQVKTMEKTSFTLMIVDAMGRTVFSAEKNNADVGVYTYKPEHWSESGGSFSVVIKTDKSFLVKPVIRLK